MPGPDIPYQAPRGCPDPLPHHLILRREVNFPMGQHAFFKNVFVSLPQTAVQANDLATTPLPPKAALMAAAPQDKKARDTVTAAMLLDHELTLDPEQKRPGAEAEKKAASQPLSHSSVGSRDSVSPQPDCMFSNRYTHPSKE